MNDELRIVLTGPAKNAHDQMLVQARNGKTSINSSQLINWIVADYFERYFQKRKDTLCKAHFNERKLLLEIMKIEDPVQRRRALQDAARSIHRKRTPKVRPQTVVPTNAVVDSE